MPLEQMVYRMTPLASKYPIARMHASLERMIDASKHPIARMHAAPERMIDGSKHPITQMHASPERMLLSNA